MAVVGGPAVMRAAVAGILAAAVLGVVPVAAALPPPSPSDTQRLRSDEAASVTMRVQGGGRRSHSCPASLADLMRESVASRWQAAHGDDCLCMSRDRTLVTVFNHWRCRDVSVAILGPHAGVGIAISMIIGIKMLVADSVGYSGLADSGPLIFLGVAVFVQLFCAFVVATEAHERNERWLRWAVFTFLAPFLGYALWKASCSREDHPPDFPSDWPRQVRRTRLGGEGDRRP